MDVIKTVKTKKLFFSASERPRTVLNAFLECMYFDKMDRIWVKVQKALRFKLKIHVFWPFLGPFWPLFELRSYVNSYANYVGYRNYLGYVKVSVTELFSLNTVIPDPGITRNSGVLA